MRRKYRTTLRVPAGAAAAALLMSAAMPAQAQYVDPSERLIAPPAFAQDMRSGACGATDLAAWLEAVGKCPLLY